jgi:RNA polymerase sigma-70 factor (ECF subfamily)
MKPTKYEHGKKFIKSLRVGEEIGFNHFFSIYYKALCFFANRYLNDLPKAEDIVSEGFLQLWANRDKIRSESHLRNWLYKAVYHLCLDQLAKSRTKEKHLKILQQVSGVEENDYTRNIIQTETLRQLKQAIDLLPGQCKKIFYKLYIEGKTVKETAQEMQLAISTIDNQKARGIKLLKDRLAPHLLTIPAALLLSAVN